MKKEAVIFAIVVIGLTWIIDAFHLPYGDELWLIASILAAHLMYWFGSSADDGYVEYIGPILGVVFAAYIVVLKAPRLFIGVIDYRVAQVVCLLIYGSCAWFIIKKGSKRRVDLQNHRNGAD